jgi:microcystin-dependent protein
MTNFQTQPATTDTYTNILQQIRDRNIALAKMDYTGLTNLPTGAIRANASNSYKLERWNGSSWVALDFITTIDNHIANTTIHQPTNVGAIEMITYGTADSGWLLCRGQSLPTSGTYAALFAKIGYTFGGSGANFTLPNLCGYIPIGVFPTGQAGYSATFAPINALGLATGTFSHSHTTPTHTHTISSHDHDMADHKHSVGAHKHILDTHRHTVAGHSHDTQASGATIAIALSGSHTHSDNDTKSTNTGSGSTVSYTWNNGSGTVVAQTIDSTNSNHTHPNSAFTGKVGNVTGGVNGDATFNTGYSGDLETRDNTAFDSGGSGTTRTGGSGTLTSNAAEGGGTSGTNNPPVLAINFQIKF